MRKPIIAGNWKMNKTLSEAKSFVEEDQRTCSCKRQNGISYLCTCIISRTLGRSTKGTDVKIGAQNMHFEENGAFTGEISPGHLQT